MRSKLSHTFIQRKERNIAHWVLGDSEVVDVGMLDFRDKTSCLSCSLWLKTNPPNLLSLLFFVAKNLFSSCQLPIALVRGDGDGVGKVDASRMFAWHRYLEKRFFVAVVEILWQTRRFVAKHKRVAFGKAALV